MNENTIDNARQFASSPAVGLHKIRIRIKVHPYNSGENDFWFFPIIAVFSHLSRHRDLELSP